METIQPLDRIVALAKAAGLSERKACENAGLNPTTIASARRKSGELDLKTIKAFAAAFGVPVSQLLGEEPENGNGAVNGPAQIIGIEHDRIHPSPLNPRKKFDQAALEELSHSVEEKGILQQLLVRVANQPGNRPIPDAKPGDYEIVAGERRWRAAGLVIARGAFPANYIVPVRIVEACDDLELLKLALTENTARNDMTPIEEAEAYATLAAAGASTAEIGKVAGRNARTVQKRLKLINDLTPKARAAVAEGEVSVEFANVLAAYCPKSKQEGTLDEIRRGQWSTSSNLKDACLRLTRPTRVAFFDLAKYKGELLEDDDAPGIQYFVDGDQFERLQQAAVDAKIEELLKAYSWAEVYDYKANKYFYKSDYDVKKGDPSAGGIIEIKHDRSVHVHLNLVKRSRQVAGAGSAPAERAPAEPVTKGHCIHAHQRKTLAMQEAIAAAPMTAMRLVCAALLGSTEAVKISADEIRDGAISEKVKSTIARFAAPADTLKGSKGLAFNHKGARIFEYDYYSQGHNDHAGLWAHLAAMGAEDVTELFAGLVALRCGSFDDYNPVPGDRDAAVAIAQTLGLVGNEAEHGLTLQAEDLDGVRKDTLITCAKAAGIDGKMSDMKAKDLARYFSQMAGPQYVFPSLKFAPMAAVKDQLAGNAARDVSPTARQTATDPENPEAIPFTSLSDLVNQQLEKLAQESRDEENWDADEKLYEIARAVRDEDGVICVETDEQVRRALVQGINACRLSPLDTPIAGEALFETDDAPVDVTSLINDLFEIYAATDDYAQIDDLDDAVAFVCKKLGVGRAFVSRSAAE